MATQTTNQISSPGETKIRNTVELRYLSDLTLESVRHLFSADGIWEDMAEYGNPNEYWDTWEQSFSTTVETIARNTADMISPIMSNTQTSSDKTEFIQQLTKKLAEQFRSLINFYLSKGVSWNESKYYWHSYCQIVVSCTKEMLTEQEKTINHLIHSDASTRDDLIIDTTAKYKQEYLKKMSNSQTN